MVIIYKVFVRYKTANGHDYTDINYYLNRSQAYKEAKARFEKRCPLSSEDKIIVQEISIYENGARISNCDYFE